MADNKKTKELMEKWRDRMKELDDLFGGIDGGGGGGTPPAPAAHEPEHDA